MLPVLSIPFRNMKISFPPVSGTSFDDMQILTFRIILTIFRSWLVDAFKTCVKHFSGISLHNMQVIFRIILTIFGTGYYLMIFISLQDIVRFLDLGEHHDGDGSVLWGLFDDFDGNHHDFCLRHFSRASASTSVQNSGK